MPLQCSGRPAPCKACRNTDTEADCVFDLTLDLRRKVAQRRTIDEREYYRNVLSSLLDELRSSDPVRINELVNFIRSDASMGRIATVLADTSISLDDFSSVNLNNHQSVESAIQSLLPPPDPCSTNTCSRITLESLVDIPLFQVPAKPWTNVTDDDNLVSHLISLYFTWDHPCWQLVDQKVFLLHMKTGDLGSQYCTPFLVNSILAIASVCHQCRSNCVLVLTNGRYIPMPQMFLLFPEMRILAGRTSTSKPKDFGEPKRVQSAWPTSRAWLSCVMCEYPRTISSSKRRS